ncbi:MAG: GGDEF domain-containing protein, partial [Acidobacteriaceae bacterium]
PSFRTIVESGDITVLHHGNPPAAQPVTYDQLIHLELDGRRVRVRGVVRAADLLYGAGVTSTYLKMLDDGRPLDASVENGSESALHGLLDAEVEVTGVAAGVFDSKMQQTGVVLHASSMADVKILKRARSNPWTLPAMPMDQILRGYRMRDDSKRVRVHGTITYYEPGNAVVLQDGARSLRIATEMATPLRIGDIADATGFPSLRDGFLNLTRGEVRDSHVYAPVTPLRTNWKQLTTSDNIHLGHIFDLVSIDAEVLQETRETGQDKYVLAADGHLFTAIYRHSDRKSLIPLPPMKEIALGSRVRVTGICIQRWSRQWTGTIPFDLLLRSSDDITVIARPSPLNIRNLMLMAGLLFLVVMIAGARGWRLERKLRQQTVAMAQHVNAEAALARRSSELERQRSLILEEISGTTSLPEILIQITEMVSSMLDGAICWCEMSKGGRLGGQLQHAAGLRVMKAKIYGRSESRLGILYVGLPWAQRDTEGNEALVMGVRLAALAMETRRLYSDLLRRSEYDLLTDIHNRFSFEKHLELLIQGTRENDGIFGLIYIDLDDFKQVNDVYGHSVGDLYLQEAAVRMKRQLRPTDMLARLGGDEFAVLVPQVRGRDCVESVARRLEHCFDGPFAVDGYALHFAGSVGIALYPEDATTQTGLLSTADAAMYVEKKTKKLGRELSSISSV